MGKEGGQMHIYAYNNPYNNMGQIISKIIPFGIFAGQQFDDILNAANNDKNSNYILVSRENGDINLTDIIENNDVIITSTLTNFSLDFISALQTVANLNKMNVRVIAYQEEFDSYKPLESILMAALPLMHKFRKNSFKARRANQIEGIEKAAAEGRYRGRKSYNPSDFPEFRDLYNKYMFRDIGKKEFAEILGVSRPTLDKLIDDYTKKGD